MQWLQAIACLPLQFVQTGCNSCKTGISLDGQQAKCDYAIMLETTVLQRIGESCVLKNAAKFFKREFMLDNW